MKTARTLFFGTPDFALPSLKACYENSDLLAVVSQPDRPRGRGHKLSPSPVKEQAARLGLPVFCMPSLKKPSAELDDFLKFVAQHKPELFVVTAYGNILPQNILDLPALGAVNVHASLLPRWRGAAPIQRSLEAGDTHTGVSLQKMVFGLDAGDVLLEKTHPLHPTSNAITLSQELSQLGGELCVDLFSYLKQHASLPQGAPQDPALVTHAAKIGKDEALWRPTWTAVETDRRVRAFRAWPTVKFRHQDQDIKILEGRPAATSNRPNENSSSPGELIKSQNQIFLACANHEAYELITVQAPNRGPVTSLSFFDEF